MDLEYGPAYRAYREAVREFLKGWPLEGAESALSQIEQESLFRRRGIEAGFVYRNMPREYGGAGQEPDALKDQIVLEEFHRANAPGDLRSQGAGLLAPTLLEFGTEAQKQRFIPAALSGEEAWCQGYSEPGSGSDLASLKCQGRAEGDSFVLTGQKIWTSNANAADWMFGLFRTEPEKPKHAGKNNYRTVVGKHKPKPAIQEKARSKACRQDVAKKQHRRKNKSPAETKNTLKAQQGKEAYLQKQGALQDSTPIDNC